MKRVTVPLRVKIEYCGYLSYENMAVCRALKAVVDCRNIKILITAKISKETQNLIRAVYLIKNSVSMPKRTPTAILAITVILIVGLQTIWLAQANPMTYSPRKPAVPEFSLSYSFKSDSNSVWNKSIAVNIQNQPTPYILCYNIKCKSHQSQNWTTYEYYANSSYLTPELFIPNRLLASNSTITTLTFSLEENRGNDNFKLNLGKVNNGDQIDFQVQAYIGDWFAGRMVNATTSIDYQLLNIDARGDWSPTQTVTIQENSAVNPSVPLGLGVFALVILFIAVLLVVAVLRKHK
jgi:hypothetical protein